MNNQAPRYNNQINSKFQTPIIKQIGHWSLVIGYYLVLGSWLLVIGRSEAQIGYPVQYPVIATVNNAADGTSANGKTAIIHDASNQGIASAVMANNTVIINFFFNQVRPAGTYQISVPRTTTEAGSPGNYGAGPVDFTISGNGWDRVATALTIGAGQGPGPGVVSTPEAPTPIQEPAPRITEIRFGNRVYQRQLVAQGRKFTTSTQPNIQARIAIAEPFAVAAGAAGYSVTVDPGTSNAKNLTIAAGNVAAAGANATLSLSLAEALTEGAHVFSVSARSAGTLGIPGVGTVLATVEVLGGPVRLIADPLTFPSPFSIRRNRTVTIQYELSTNANIDLYLAGVGGVYLKKFSFSAGSEGGSAGVNKVVWDGVTDQGYLAGNAIYVGTVIARDENRLLGKLKLTIVD